MATSRLAALRPRLGRWRWLLPVLLWATLGPATTRTPVVAQSVTDFSISHIEYLQVVQRWDNTVPLVQDKPLLVRIYVQASGPNGPLAGGRWSVGTAAMDVWKGTSTTATNYLGNLTPLNSTITVAPTAVDPLTLRYNQAATFNFLIPDNWTDSENIYLRMGFNLQRTVAESNYGNNNRDLVLRLNRTLPLNIVQLWYTSPQHPEGSAPFSDFTKQLQLAVRSWPIPYINTYHLATDTVNFSTVTDRNRTDDIYFPGADAILDKLEALRKASSSHGGHSWYALTPWDNGCHGNAFDIGRGGVGSAEGQNNFTNCTTGAVMSQELGHLWGQLHTGHVGATNFPDPNCCPHGGISRNPSNPVLGFNSLTRTIIAPGTPSDTQAHVHDAQGYGSCPCWISDYTYERLFNILRVTTIRSPADTAFVDQELAQITGGQAKQLAAQPDTRPYLFVRGSVDGDQATFAPTYVMDGVAEPDDSAGEGPYVIEARDAAGAVLRTRAFDISGRTHPGEEDGPTTFLQVLPWEAGTRSLLLRRGDLVLATLTASAGAPAVTILTPGAGVDWNGPRAVTWEASDPDGDPLTYMVEYSADGGRTWLALAEGLTEPRLAVNAGLLAGSKDCLVRVIASDGLNTTMAVSAPFGVDRHPPLMVFPEDAMLVMENGQVMMTGDGFDPDDGPLPQENLVWTMDGDTVIGAGRSVMTAPLTAGRHTITLTITDLDGNAVSIAHDIEVTSAN